MSIAQKLLVTLFCWLLFHSSQISHWLEKKTIGISINNLEWLKLRVEIAATKYIDGC